MGTEVARAQLGKPIEPDVKRTRVDRTARHDRCTDNDEQR